MKIEYNDLKNLINDFRYIIQTGGNPFVQQGSGVVSSYKSLIVMFVDILKSLIYLIIYGVVLYLIYIILFKGYPKFVMDVISLGFFKKQNLDGLFSENKFLESHFKFLLKVPSEFTGIDPYITFEKLVLTNDLRNAISDLNTNMNEYYKDYKYTRRYVETFREYYLYFYKLNKDKGGSLDVCKSHTYLEDYRKNNALMKSNNRQSIDEICKVKSCSRVYIEKIVDPQFKIPQCRSTGFEKYVTGFNQQTLPSKVDCPAPLVVLEYADFYDTLLEYLVRTGKYKLKGRDKEFKNNRTARLVELYYKDITNVTNNIQRVRTMNCSISKVAAEVKKMVNKVNEYNFSLFITTPNLRDQEIKRKFSSAFMNYHTRLYHSSPVTVYDDSIKFSELDEYTWYMFEAIYGALNFKTDYKVFYNILDGQINDLLKNTPYEVKLFLTSYINLDVNKKRKAESTILLSYENIQYNKKLVSTIEWINKHPIFSHIYFNSKITTKNKQELYNKVLFGYEYLMTSKKKGTSNVSQAAALYNNQETYPLTNNNIGFQLVENLINNARHFKEYINAINILDLYLNVYQQDLSTLYMQQYRSNIKFFEELWNPYFQSIFEMRILQYFRRMFSTPNFARSFSRFMILWRIVGRSIKRLKTEIGNAFKRGMSMPPEQAPPSEGE